MKHIIVDAYLGGTGIRDKDNGGYIDPEELNLSRILCQKITKWLDDYWDQFYNDYPDNNMIRILDQNGLDIANAIKVELTTSYEIEYFSDAHMKYLPL